MKLTKTQKELMCHCIGVQDFGGRKKPKPYRNYFSTGNRFSDIWDDLVRQGFAIMRDRRKRRGGIYYHLTDKALQYMLDNRSEFLPFDGRIKLLKTMTKLCD
jgi:hypothetical protein